MHPLDLTGILVLLEKDYLEVFIYGVVFVFIIVLLFILNRFLRVGVGNKVKTQQTPFAMTREDLDRLKQSGALSEEEIKHIKDTMNRRFLERMKEEEEARRKPAKADVILTEAEKEILGGGKPTPAGDAAPPRPPITRAAPAASAPPPPTVKRTELPENLQPFASLSDFEIDEMRQAGFLGEDDAQRIRKARENL